MFKEQAHQIIGDDGGDGDDQKKVAAVAQQIDPQRDIPCLADDIDAQNVEQDGAGGGQKAEMIDLSLRKALPAAIIKVEHEYENDDQRK